MISELLGTDCNREPQVAKEQPRIMQVNESVMEELTSLSEVMTVVFGRTRTSNGTFYEF